MMRSATRTLLALLLTAGAITAAFAGCGASNHECLESCNTDSNCADGYSCLQLTSGDSSSLVCLPAACSQCPTVTSCTYTQDANSCTFTSCEQ